MSEYNPTRRDGEPHANNQNYRPRQELIPIPWRANLDPEGIPDKNKDKDALTYHLDKIESDGKAEATIDSHERRLNRFLDWLCPNPILTEEENATRRGPDIRHTGELTSRHIKDWEIERSSDIAPTTMKTECDTVRVFLRNLEGYGALPQGFHRYVDGPSLSEDEERRENAIDVDRGHQITEYLRKYEWGSERHVFWELIWTTSMRIGGAHSIDVPDIDFETGQIRLRHRPESGTTLKNGSGMDEEGGERNVIVSQTVLDAIEDWFDHADRPDDPIAEGDRIPLFPNDDGTKRRCKQFLRDLCYAMTRPCACGEGCPHDKDPNTCEAAQSKNKAYACPSSTTPHPVRAGAITRMLDNNVPKRIVSDEVDASEGVIDKHYDEGGEDHRAEIRREYLERDDTHRDE